MIVCICHNVSDRDIAQEVRGGCESFARLQERLAVGTGCGNCTDCAIDTFRQHAGPGAGVRAGTSPSRAPASPRA